MTVTITSTDPTAQEANALIAFAEVFGGAAPTVAGGATGTTTAPVNSFPSNPALAPFPSPDSSAILVLGGAVSGEPYLRDANGGVWTLAIVNGQGVPSLNGVAINTAGSGANITELIIRGNGQLWAQVGSGQWQMFNNSMGGFYNGSLPPAASTSTSGTSGTTTVAPALPTPTTTPGGSSGRTLTVGASGATYTTITAAIQAAQAGDLITVAPGTYAETPPAWTVPLRISSVSPGATIDCGGKTATLARGKAALVPCADSILDWLIPINVATDQTSGQLTSGIRPDVGCGYLVTNNCGGNNNQCGVGMGSVACVWTDNGGSYLDCGLTGDGLSHAIYCATGTLIVTLNGTKVSSPQGHGVQVPRASAGLDRGVWFRAERYILDVPDGLSQAGIVSGVTFTKTATDPNHGIVGLCMESTANGTAGIILSACVIAAQCPSPLMESNAGTITVNANCTFSGNVVTAQVTGTGAVTGLPTAA